MNRPPMKAAADMAEFYRVLTPGALTPKEKAFYVPIYEENLRQIRAMLTVGMIEAEAIYVAGQSGTGKTTALNFLPNEALAEQFEIIPIYCDEILDLGDVNIIELLLTLSFQLVKGKPQLEQLFEKKLQRIENNVKEREIRETQNQINSKSEGGGNIKAGIGNDIARFFSIFKMEANFFANLRLSSEHRELVRKVLVFHKRDLFELTNDIIKKYEELETNKRLLLIINELDHMKDARQIDQLFGIDRQWLEDLKCRKVISVPIIVLTKSLIKFNCYSFGLKMQPNPLKTDNIERSTTASQTARQLLREIVHKRVTKEADLITDEAVELAISLSGGIVRQYISILQRAALGVIGKVGVKSTLSENDISNGSLQLKQNLSLSILTKQKIQALKEVLDHHQPSGDKDIDFQELLLSNKVLVFHNDPTWYELNPLLKQTIQVYAEPKNDA